MLSKRTLSFLLLVSGLFFSATVNLYSQTDVASEEALKKEANKAFEDEDYALSTKLYSRLLSVNLKDPVYNYRYGVSLLNASADKDEAVKYLEKASRDASTEKDVFFYYAKALQLNYRFNDAIASYSKFKSLVSESKAAKMQVDHMIETCRNGKKLLRKITDLLVIEKKELSDKDFFLSYDLQDIGGRLLVKPDEFKTSLDKKKKENSIIFLSPDKSEIYFSSYGNSDENGKDIYLIKRLPNGEYSKPQTLGYPINTEYDDDYPFLHPNGKVLYFASKGHNSMGGYDIFKSERNEETGTWQKPVNLDFAINTPDDDILFVTDKDEKTAFFASRRNSESGKIDVYHINIDRKPVDVCIFKGKFTPKTGGQSLAAKITVKDVDINEIEGVFKTNESTGDYLMDLPNGGKFLVTVETSEGDVQSDMLIIPPQYETVPIRQEIVYKTDENGKMHVNSFFGENKGDDDNFALALDFIKERSKLDVNTSKDNKEKPVTALKPDSTDLNAAKDTLSHDRKNVPVKNLSNDDLIKIAQKDADDLQKEASESKSAADKALTIVNEKNQKAQELNKKVQEANTLVASTTDQSQKQIEQSRADALQIQADNAEAEAKGANNFYKSLDAESAKKQKEADLSRKYAKDFSAAIKSKSKDALAKLEVQKEELDKMTEEKSGADDMVSGIRKEADAKQKEVDQARDETGKIKEDITGLHAEIDNLNKDASETKNEQLKAGIADQITGLKEEIANKEKDLTDNEVKVSKLQKQAENLNNQADLVRKMNEEIKSGDVVASAGTIDKAKLDEQISGYKKDEIAHAETSGNPVKSSQGDNGKTAPGDDGKQGVDGIASGVHDKTEKEGTTTDGTADKKTNAVSELVTKSGKDIDAPYENRLSDADTKNTALEKEQAKAAVYKAWADELGESIHAKKEALNTTKDKTAKAGLKAEIEKEQNEQKEKQELVKESDSRIEKLKAAESIASTDKGKTTLPGSDSTQGKQLEGNGLKTDGVAATRTTGPDTTASASVNSEKMFEDKLKLTDTIGKPLDKEEAKARLYADRSEALNNELSEKKKELSKTKDKDEKSKLKAEITALQKKNEENKTLEKQTLASAEKLKKEREKAPEVTSTQSAYETTYANQLSATDTLKGAAALDSAKASVYKNWVDALTSDIETRKGKLPKIKNKDKRKAEEQAIASLETELTGKEAVAQQFATLAEQEKAKRDFQTSAAGKQELVEGPVEYKDKAAIADNETKQKLEKEAADLKTKSDEAFSEGAKLSGDARSSKLKEASDLEKSSREKLIGAAELTAKANQEESKKNEMKLAQYSAAPDAGSKPEVSKAEALKEEARVYREKAKKSRESASKDDSFYGKQVDQKNAEDYERAAIQKEAEALGIYAAAYPGLKLKEEVVADAGTVDVKTNDGAIAKTEGVKKETDGIKAEDDKGNNKSPEQRDGVKTNDGTIAKTEGVKKETDGIKAEDDKGNNKSPEQRDGVKTNDGTIAKTEGVKKETDGIKAEDDKGSNKSPEQRDGVKTNDGAIAKTEGAKKETDGIKTEDDKGNNKNPEQRDGVKTTDGAIKEGNNPLADRGLVAKTADNADEGLSATDIALKKTEPYKKFTYLKAEMSVDEVEVKENNKKADDYQHAAESYTNQSQELLSNSDAMADTARKGEAVRKAKEYNDLASLNLARADSVRKISVEKNQTLSAKRKESESLLADLDPATKERIVALNEKELDKASRAGAEAKISESGKQDTKQETGAADDFMITAVAAVPKTIPVDKKLPEGLVFKVQVGAFRNPISGDLFRGVNPLTGESTDKGFIRYTAGLFNKFESADKAKNDIHALGFKDAFVVAFLNGKRIPVNDAVAMSKGQKTETSSGITTPDGMSLAGNPLKTVKTPDHGEVAAVEQDNKAKKGTQPGADHPQSGVIAKATNVSEIEGLFYTVQVGVFSGPVSSDKLFGIQSLNTEKMENGNLRYTTGQYADKNKAVEAQKKIVDLGIRDAFVVAYYKGKRLTMAQARDVEAGNPSGIIKPVVGENSGNEHASKNPVTENNSPPAKTEASKQPDVHSETVAPVKSGSVVTEGLAQDFSNYNNHILENVKSDSGIVFRVQLGAFKEEVPLEIANKFLLFAKRGVKTIKDENGNTVFMAGSLRKYEDASFLKEEAVAKGIPDAFIIAFKDGMKIPVSEAKEIK